MVYHFDNWGWFTDERTSGPLADEFAPHIAAENGGEVAAILNRAERK